MSKPPTTTPLERSLFMITTDTDRYSVQSYYPDHAVRPAYRVYDELHDVPLSGPYVDLATAEAVAVERSAEWAALDGYARYYPSRPKVDLVKR
jgi:hypothetical protein